MNISQGQSTKLTAIPLNAGGTPVALLPNDVPAWSTDAPASVDLTPSADGLSLLVAVHADAPAGDINFQITDSLPPNGNGSFVLTVTPAVVPNPVASFSVTASTPA